ncbi:MAG: hypothetical protein D6798_02500 [Deltaproteobacteria bacterium]|nr:MAG: hypothetical protein D6798_02500 [Deltaproteobacteria bacterium]
MLPAMSAARHARAVEDIARDLDLLVFRLERPPARDAEGIAVERVRLRRELEQLRDRLQDVARALDPG